MDGEALPEVAGRIYDAALDAAFWPPALEGIARYLPATAVYLFAEAAARRNAPPFLSHGFNPAYLDAYLKKYVALNPMFPAALFFDIGAVVTTDDVIPAAEFRETIFYNEWQKPQGFVDGLAATVEKTSACVAVLSALRSERDGPADAAARQRMADIVPHVRRAVAIGNILDLEPGEWQSLAQTLDPITASTILVDAGGHVVNANASARRLLKRGSVLHEAKGRLTAADPGADRSLRETIAAAGDPEALGKLNISIELKRESDEHWLAHTLPLGSGARRKIGARHGAAAAVIVRKTEGEPPHPVLALAAAYKLTPPEVRVLMSVVQTGSAADVGGVLGISEAAVTAHLHSMIEKTGTNSQAELAKLVARYASALGG